MTAQSPVPPPVTLPLLVEPARPGWVRTSPRAPWLVVATVCLGAFMGQLDASIVTVALPSVQLEFAASLGGAEWISLSYLMTLIILVVPVGRVADMLGRKLLYTYGFLVFTAASVGCGLAPNLGVLVGLRVLQALGAALLQANSVALIATAVPRGMLGRAVGVQGAAQAIGLAVGPAVGGALVAAGGWRWVFLVNAPVGVLSVVSGFLLLPRTRRFSPRTPFDWPGLALLASAVGAALLALSRAEHDPPGRLVALAAAAAAAGTALVLHERNAAAPMLPPALFARWTFSGGLAAGLLSYLAMFGVLFATPFLLVGRGETPGMAGLVLTALPAALAIAAPLAGRLADHTGARLPTAGGLAMTAAALAVLAATVPPTPTLAGLLALIGLGLGAFTPANNAAIMASAPAEQSAVAGGVLNMTRGLGTALGVALTGLFLAGHRGTTSTAAYRTAMMMLVGCAALGAAIAAHRSAAPKEGIPASGEA